MGTQLLNARKRKDKHGSLKVKKLPINQRELVINMYGTKILGQTIQHVVDMVTLLQTA
jgi:hypothetical protein